MGMDTADSTTPNRLSSGEIKCATNGRFEMKLVSAKRDFGEDPRDNGLPFISHLSSWRIEKSVGAEFQSRLVHGHDIFGRRIVLQLMRRGKAVATARHHDPEGLLDALHHV